MYHPLLEIQTTDGMMIRLHSGFDSLDFAIEATITKKAAEHLAWAQGAAREKREAQLATYGGRDFHVAESGASGGYRYRLDTGPFGETWFVKEPNRTDPWGCLLYTSPSPRDATLSRMPSSA